MAELTLSGFEEFRNKLEGLSKEVLEEANELTKDAMGLWEQRAKERAPFDTGHLAGNITPHEINPGEWELTSEADYSAYQEFGTGDRVDVPPELAEYARQFQGAKKIEGGVPAQHFFFGPKEEVEKFWLAELKKILETER